MLIHVLKAI